MRRVAAAAVIAASVLAAFAGAAMLGGSVEAPPPLARADDAQRAMSYACGYLAGQTGMATAFGRPDLAPRWMPSCDARKANAVANGFTTQ